ncbi:MAG TPA: metallophosphoesterase family protein [Verrucomicrobiae bacterium]|nr:metallophosphoesterase family protein [Verrucomicrobiae bacterium]
MKIGVISDTHNFLDPKIPTLFQGVEHILHAGDIGQAQIILQLENIAQVTAVLGNNDTELDYKETEIVELAGKKFMVHHIVNVHRPSDTVRRRVELDKPDVVVFGHSHRPFNEMIGRTLYFNPGYAGKPRFNDPRSVAILHCDKKEIRAEYFGL